MGALVLLSVVLIVLDTATRWVVPIRSALVTVVAPVQYAVEFPYLLTSTLQFSLTDRNTLVALNEAQAEEILRLSHSVQQLASLKAENDSMRALLDSKARLPDEVTITEIVGIVPDPNRKEVIIDKGRIDDVSVGQAVLHDQGLFGQVIEVGQLSSRVMLIVDQDHAVPVRVVRSGVRSIAGGSGSVDELFLEHVPKFADIKVGDVVVTSGLGGRFPQGYPVGEVAKVDSDQRSGFATIRVAPAARLSEARHLLIVRPSEEPSDLPAAVGSEGSLQ